MLTKAALETLDDPGREREREQTDLTDKKDRMKYGALQVYNSELERPTHLDLGLHGVTRAALRALCKGAVIESSTTVKRRYSYSALSSAISLTNGDNTAMSALRQMQKERLIVSRLGFPDRAMEIDREIDLLRSKVRIVREKEERELVEYRLKMLHAAQFRKQARFEQIIGEETRLLEIKLEEEKQKMRRRQQEEFMRVLENASRRALGKIKKCNCAEVYLCKHNKTASYNTRRPTKIVVQYRRNGKRLRQSGRAEEGAAWEEKAKELDEQQQERWRTNIATSIVASPWGANEAVVDQLTEGHKRELQVLYKTQAVKRDVHNKQQDLRRRNFLNTCEAEERKVKMQCRKQALLRSQADAAEAAREAKRQEKVSYKSDGLQNISKNLLGMEFDEAEKGDSDWRPPTTFGLDNSKRLADEFSNIKDSDDVKDISNRILISRKDMLKGKNINDDSDDSENEEQDENEVDGQNKEFLEELTEDERYKFGETSGSKLMDRIRKKEARRRRSVMREELSSEGTNSPRSPRTPRTWQTDDSNAPQTPDMPNGEVEDDAVVSGGGGEDGVAEKKLPPSGGGPFSTPASQAPTAVGGWTAGTNPSPFVGGPSSVSSPFGSFSSAPLGGNLSATPSAGNLFGGSMTLQASASNLLGGIGQSTLFGTASNASLFKGASPFQGFGAYGPSAPPPTEPAPPASAAPAAAAAAAAQSAPPPAAGGGGGGGGSNPFNGPQKGSEPPAPAALVPSKPSAPPPSGASPRASRTAPPASQFSAKPVSKKNLGRVGDNVDLDVDVDDDDDHSSVGFSTPDKDNRRQSVSSTSNRGRPTSPKANKMSKPPIVLVNGRLPPDWTLDLEDELPPSFKPGSVKDEDWKEKDELLAQTVGMENSYGVALTIPERDDEVHEPDLKAVPAKGILTNKSVQKQKKKDEKAPDEGGFEKKRVSFGEVKMRIYEVEEEEEVQIAVAVAEVIKGDDDEEENVHSKAIMVEKPLAKRHPGSGRGSGGSKSGSKDKGSSKSKDGKPPSSPRSSGPASNRSVSPAASFSAPTGGSSGGGIAAAAAAASSTGSSAGGSGGGGSSQGAGSDGGTGDISPKKTPSPASFFSPSLMLRGQSKSGDKGKNKPKWGESRDDDSELEEENSKASSPSNASHSKDKAEKIHLKAQAKEGSTSTTSSAAAAAAAGKSKGGGGSGSGSKATTAEEDEISRYERELEDEVESLRSQLEEKLSKSSSNGSNALDTSSLPMMNDPVYMMKQNKNKEKEKNKEQNHKQSKSTSAAAAASSAQSPASARKQSTVTRAGDDDDDLEDDLDDDDNDDIYNTSKDKFSELDLSKISHPADESSSDYCQPVGSSVGMPSPGGSAFDGGDGGGRSAMMAEALKKYSQQMDEFDNDLQEEEAERKRDMQAASAALMPHKNIKPGQQPQSPQEDDDDVGGGDVGDDDKYGDDDYEDEEEEEEEEE